jgi:hypothetical protein
LTKEELCQKTLSTFNTVITVIMPRKGGKVSTAGGKSGGKGGRQKGKGAAAATAAAAAAEETVAAAQDQDQDQDQDQAGPSDVMRADVRAPAKSRGPGSQGPRRPSSPSLEASVSLKKLEKKWKNLEICYYANKNKLMSTLRTHHPQEDSQEDPLEGL